MGSVDRFCRGAGGIVPFAMAEKPKPRRDCYDVSGNVEAQYVDDAQAVLVNKKGIGQLER